METRSAEPSITTPSGDSAPVRVVLHIQVPRFVVAARGIGFDAPVAGFLFAGAIRAILADELPEGSRPGLLGDFCDGLIVIHTHQREAAVKKLKRFFEREESFFGTFVTIAWWCESENMWRLVKRGIDQSSFESRMTDERHTQREAVTERVIQQLALADAQLAAHFKTR